MNYCLACHKKLEDGNINYHQNCLTAFWQEDTPVLKLEYEMSQIEALAKENVAQRIIVTGVQPKLSLGFTQENAQNRLTIVGALNGRYILKPPFQMYPQMPEIEALSMLLAQACGIATVPFLLIPLKDGALAYLTKRIDRTANNEKYPMEDACQFTERLTEHKYRGSYEQIAKGVITYAQNPLLDAVKFYEQVIVSFLIGNNDMHLKNFSLIAQDSKHYTLAPAYDMVAVKLLIPEDQEELALNLNGKKRKIKRLDFNEAMTKAQIPAKAIENLWNRIEKGMQQWQELIACSFLSKENKSTLMTLIENRAKQLELNTKL
ncbi:serine/threonine-protein kinase HipA [Oceanihabitans sediminis]|uniref:Type II toxin-antitoxin system HipA family toxin n=1 Tax=Oceanihabitans sediminis TaxID=1812012 RepID=A0A368P5V4_9FLAO|nr:HipA domain-containing protein [Oceanihabitans sediminis]RBP32797.1 serine/threonine-protein kinase HipA [Oceanihabitans sediminis]RCU57670.1 type II toxin-antitoxin system HipA family toxin [Oceanihabitans sediminis]